MAEEKEECIMEGGEALRTLEEHDAVIDPLSEHGEQTRKMEKGAVGQSKLQDSVDDRAFVSICSTEKEGNIKVEPVDTVVENASSLSVQLSSVNFSSNCKNPLDSFSRDCKEEVIQVKLEPTIIAESFLCDSSNCLPELPNLAGCSVLPAPIKEFQFADEKVSLGCSYCEYKGLCLRDLRKHLALHGDKKHLKCDHCQYRTYHKGALKIHLMTHSGERPFKCDKCSYRASEKRNLTRHLMTHSGEKPFACDQCSYRTSQKKNLQTHMTRHTKEKPFACGQCPYKASQQACLARHLLLHSGKKPYHCELCPYKATQKRHLNTHMLSHTKERPIKCELCTYKTSVKWNLKRHMLVHK